jgi:hypothetical protein
MALTLLISTWRADSKTVRRRNMLIHSVHRKRVHPTRAANEEAEAKLVL